MSGAERRAKKQLYKDALLENFSNFKSTFIITVDNVGSNQLQQVRLALRGRAVILMGKNTIMRKCLRDEAEKNPKLGNLLPYIQGNMGFCFTNEDLIEIRDVIKSNTVPAAARGNQIAPLDVFVPAGPTALDPGQTNFFQALNIATKITRGAIEILNEVHLVKKGERVSSSAVAMLNKIGLRPFSYNVEVQTVYEDGSVYDAKFLDMTDDEIISRFGAASCKLAAISYAIKYPNKAIVPHAFQKTLKKLLALSCATDYTFEESKTFKEYLANPELLAALSAGAGGDAGAAGGAAAAAPVEEEEEEEEEPVAMFGEEEAADY